MSRSVPVPSLVSAPAPETIPLSTSCELSVKKVPKPASSTARPEMTVDKVRSVPPLKLKPPTASPRLVSLRMLSVPPLIAVPPV
jgi:hypothetical protein